MLSTLKSLVSKPVGVLVASEVGKYKKVQFFSLLNGSRIRSRRCYRATVHTDLLVIGCGIAGASAALKAAELGLKVMVVSSSNDIEDCNSFWAQGGIIYKAAGDKPFNLTRDIHIAGAGLCDDTAVRKLAIEGPKRVEEILLDVADVPFNRNGSLSLCLEAGHSCPRIIHWHDQTGKAITQSVQRALLLHPSISVVAGAVATDLAMATIAGTPLSRCTGAHLLQGDQPITVLAPATVLATGGLGEIYSHTSNPKSARGDGFGMAWRAGAYMHNMEYVQFHPTTLSLPGERSFLLSEAMRGEGAVLRNSSFEAFAKNYHPRGELAPRDIVSRMIVHEMQRTATDHVYLDITHRDADWLRNRFPAIHSHCSARGIDITRDLLPVVPAAHYFCGGVRTDLSGKTSVPGLYAAGEVSCTGLHGGNRLASTSLLEGLVWGCAIAEHVTSDGRFAKLARSLETSEAIAPPPTGSWPADAAMLDEYWAKLKVTMWEHVGVIRSRASLEQAVETLDDLSRTAAQLRAESRPSAETSGLCNAADTAALIARAALLNPKSAGAHFVSDGAECAWKERLDAAA